MSYFKTSDYPKASELLANVMASESTNIDLYYALASSLIKLGKTELTGEAIQRMTKVTGDSPQLHVLLGQQYYAQGDDARALEEISAAVALNGQTLQAHYYAGLVYLKMKRFEEATREFEAELGLNSNDLGKSLKVLISQKGGLVIRGGTAVEQNTFLKMALVSGIAGSMRIVSHHHDGFLQLAIERG